MQDAIVRPTRRRVLCLGCAALLVPTAGRAAAVEIVRGSAFGTTWQMSAPEGAAPERMRPAIERAFAEVDRQMSPWRSDSEISRFNSSPVGQTEVSPDTSRVASASLTLAAQSRGAFDPTVGPLVARWGFGPISGAGPHWQGVRTGTGVIEKAYAGLTLDLCGIAKGWALDRAMAIAQDAGQGDLIIDLGGEIAALGTHPTGRRWRIAVENPLADAPPPAALKLPGGKAVATSGVKSQSYGIGGRTYSHIIDPASGEPAATEVKSVTVLTDDAMSADGWATALFAAGVDVGPALASESGITALFLVGDGPGLRQVATGGMERYLL